MNDRRIFLLIVLVALGTLTGCFHSEIPLDDFFRKPENSALQLSSDGKWIAYLAPYENRLNVFVRSLEKDSIGRLTSLSDGDVSSFQWTNNHCILFQKMEEASGKRQWAWVDIYSRLVTPCTEGVQKLFLCGEMETDSSLFVQNLSFGERVKYLGFMADKKEVYALSNRGRDVCALVCMDPSSGEERELIYAPERYDLWTGHYSLIKKGLTYVTYVGHQYRVRHFLDEGAGVVYERLQAFLPDYQIELVSATDTGDRFVVLATNDRWPGTYYYYSVSNDSLSKIADCMPWLKYERMARMIPVTYTTSDSVCVEAYLTLPYNLTVEEAHDMPAIVFPHDGPQQRDVWCYSPEVQLLANRGYVVLQMNYRGSAGYGRAFLEAGRDSCGKRMLDDVIEGARWLIQKGIADPKKMAVYGAGNARHMALRVAARAPELFACAVDYAGTPQSFTSFERGACWLKAVGELSASPTCDVDRLMMPLLIVQGAENVPQGEEELLKALKQKKRKVEYMANDGTESPRVHWEEFQMSFYRKLEAFLSHYLK